MSDYFIISQLQDDLRKRFRAVDEKQEKILDQQRKLLEAFNKLSGNVEKLAQEVKELRVELGPKKLDKTNTLPKRV